VKGYITVLGQAWPLTALVLREAVNGHACPKNSETIKIALTISQYYWDMYNKT
jgi:hypothetical protein